MKTHLIPKTVIRHDPKTGDPVWATWAPPASFTELRSQNELLKKECLRLLEINASLQHLPAQVEALRATNYKQSVELANLRSKLK